MPLGFDDLPGTQTAEEIDDDNLLLIVIDAADPTTFEIMTVKSIESPVSDEYPIYVMRGRQGTSKISHLSGALAYFVLRNNLSFLSNVAFETIANEAAQPDREAYFKLLPANAAEQLDIADASEIVLELSQQDDSGVAQVAMPTESPTAGDYTPGSFPLSVALTTSTSGATIRWSKTAIPNSETEGTEYTGAISVSADETIYAKAFKSGFLPSNALQALFTDDG